MKTQDFELDEAIELIKQDLAELKKTRELIISMGMPVDGMSLSDVNARIKEIKQLLA